MKTLIPLTALAALFASSSLSAQTPAFSKPSGYTTQSLPANTLSLVGINLMSPTLAAGVLTGVANGNTTLTDTGVNFGSVLSPGKTYTIEINDGPGTIDGAVQEFVTWSGNDITVPAMPGIAVGDKYKIRVVKTLQETFPVGFLAGSATVGNADKVWVPNGSGGYTKYWYRVTIAPAGWRTTTTGLNDTGAVVGDIPLPFIDGLLIEKKGASKDFVLTGEVKTTPTSALAIVGLNPISVVPPVGLTLLTSGLQTEIAGSATVANADKVWVPNGMGGYTKYWNRITIAPTGWRTTTTGLNDTGALVGDVNLPAGVLIERKGSPKSIKMNVPSGYSDL